MGNLVQFHSLPLEIRLQIWGLTFDSRTVTVHTHYDMWKIILQHDHNAFDESLTARVSAESPPTALHVCQESRHEALKEYTAICPVPGSCNSSSFYFSFDTDILCLDITTDLFDSIVQLYPSLREVKSVAVYYPEEYLMELLVYHQRLIYLTITSPFPKASKIFYIDFCQDSGTMEMSPFPDFIGEIDTD